MIQPEIKQYGRKRNVGEHFPRPRAVAVKGGRRHHSKMYPGCLLALSRGTLGRKFSAKSLISLVGARDLNSGPPVPQTGALTGLRYAPTWREPLRRAAERCKGAGGSRRSLRGVRRRRVIGPRGRHQAPDHAEQQEVMAPVVAVDQHAFGRRADEGAVDRQIGRAPGVSMKTVRSPASSVVSTSVA